MTRGGENHAGVLLLIGVLSGVIYSFVFAATFAGDDSFAMGIALFFGSILGLVTSPLVVIFLRERNLSLCVPMLWFGVSAVIIVVTITLGEPAGFLASLFAHASGLVACNFFAPRLRPPVDDTSCPRCGYDLRGTPERCPECGWCNGEPT